MASELGLILKDQPENASTRKILWFLLSAATASTLTVVPLLNLFRFSDRSDYYSHIPLIPLISAYLLYQRRKTLVHPTEAGTRWGCLVAAISLFLYATGARGTGLSHYDASSLMIFSSILFLLGSFVLLYGTRALKRSAFPLFFLLFMVPSPGAPMHRIIYFLQAGSAEVADGIFNASGISYLREGLVFQLPGFSIEVAAQCSGIRSSLALAITTFLAGHLFLHTWWQKIVLTVSILPLVLIKNGIRISVLTFLALYVDQGFLVDGFLHTSGGIFFFIPVLLLMGLLLYILRSMGGSLRPKGGASCTLARNPSADV